MSGVLFLSLYLLINIKQLSKIVRSHYIIIFFILLTSFVALLSPNLNLENFFYAVSFSIVSISSMVYASKIKTIPVSVFAFLYYLFALFIFLKLYIYFDHKEPLSKVLPHTSTNGPPSYLIFLHSLYLFGSYARYKKIPILPIFITLVVCYFGNGRGSIIVAVYIAIISFVIHLYIASSDFSFYKKVIYIVFMLFIFTFFMMYFYHELYVYIAKSTKLSVGLKDQNRLLILSEYLENLTMLEWIVGGSYENTVISTLYNGNPHISFIRTHHIFGLLGLFWYFSFLLIFKLSVNSLFYILIICTVLLRAVSEPLVLSTLLDYFYLMPLFYIYFNRYLLYVK